MFDLEGDSAKADALLAGSLVWADIPEENRHGVTEELATRVVGGEISLAQFDEIVGKVRTRPAPAEGPRAYVGG